MTFLRRIEGEDVVGIDSNSSNQGTHGESILPVVVVQVGVKRETIGSDLRSIPSIEIRTHSVKLIMTGEEKEPIEERDSLPLSLPLSPTVSLPGSTVHLYIHQTTTFNRG